MPSPRAAVSQSELTRWAKALRAAGYDEWRVQIEKPDGTKVSICAGKADAPADDGDEIDRMIEGGA